MDFVGLGMQMAWIIFICKLTVVLARQLAAKLTVNRLIPQLLLNSTRLAVIYIPFLRRRNNAGGSHGEPTC